MGSRSSRRIRDGRTTRPLPTAGTRPGGSRRSMTKPFQPTEEWHQPEEARPGVTDLRHVADGSPAARRIRGDFPQGRPVPLRRLQRQRISVPHRSRTSRLRPARPARGARAAAHGAGRTATPRGNRGGGDRIDALERGSDRGRRARRSHAAPVSPGRRHPADHGLAEGLPALDAPAQDHRGRPDTAPGRARALRALTTPIAALSTGPTRATPRVPLATRSARFAALEWRDAHDVVGRSTLHLLECAPARCRDAFGAERPRSRLRHGPRTRGPVRRRRREERPRRPLGVGRPAVGPSRGFGTAAPDVPVPRLRRRPQAARPLRRQPRPLRRRG